MIPHAHSVSLSLSLSPPPPSLPPSLYLPPPLQTGQISEEDFASRIEADLHSQHQPSLLPFLKVSSLDVLLAIILSSLSLYARIVILRGFPFSNLVFSILSVVE